MHAFSMLPDAPPRDAPRILVIDDDEVILDYVQACLETRIPGARVTRYHSRRQGRPGPDFDWSRHDLLLLDYHLGHGETGIDWLRDFSGKPGFPRVVLFTSEDSPQVVGRAVRSGADGYLNKSRLSPAALVDIVRSMLEPPAPTAPAAAAGGRGAPVAAREEDDLEDDDSGPKFRGLRTFETVPGGTRYRFIRLIGRGGMSRVYLAERLPDRMTAVLKILDRKLATNPENVQRFAREGELVAALDSPYVVRVYDHGVTDGYGYIAMEFFGRGDLAQRMRQGVSPDDALLYLHNIACGLQAIHGVGIVHRDLKPGNVMFRGDGSMALADFGLAKHLGQDLGLTGTGVILGTPHFMSPEQTRGEAADERTDLYAAGVMFYEMLTGRRPLVASTLPALLLAIQLETPAPLPDDLQRFQPVIDRLLAKEADDRYASATELLAALAPLA